MDKRCLFKAVAGGVIAVGGPIAVGGGGIAVADKLINQDDDQDGDEDE